MVRYRVVRKPKIDRGDEQASPAMDLYLGKRDLEILYSRWRWGGVESEYGQLVITSDMILRIPEQEFYNVYGEVYGRRIYATARLLAKRGAL